MKLIVCIDEKNGMMFNGRRQSRDKVLTADAAAHCKGAKLHMNPSTAKLFSGVEANLCVDESFLKKADSGEYCFCEGELPDEKKVEELVVYKWNRTYPADVFFTYDLSGWKLVESVDFAGSSHEKITKEVYVK